MESQKKREFFNFSAKCHLRQVQTNVRNRRILRRGIVHFGLLLGCYDLKNNAPFSASPNRLPQLTGLDVLVYQDTK